MSNEAIEIVKTVLSKSIFHLLDLVEKNHVEDLRMG